MSCCSNGSSSSDNNSSNSNSADGIYPTNGKPFSWCSTCFLFWILIFMVAVFFIRQGK